MANDWQRLWDELSKCQQQYLAAIYQADQAQEKFAKRSALRGNRRPAGEWRWLPYAEFTSALYSSLKENNHQVFDPLENLGYIETKYDYYGRRPDQILHIKLTPKGRRLVRQSGAIEYTPAYRFKGKLSRFQWEALVKIYPKGSLEPFSIPGASLDKLASWHGYVEYIRDPKSHWKITAAGKLHYEQHWQDYCRAYPDIQAPEPKGNSGEKERPA